MKILIRYFTLMVLLVSGVLTGQEISGWEFINKILEQNKSLNKTGGNYTISGSGMYRNNYELTGFEEPNIFHFNYKMSYSHFNSDFHYESVLTDYNTKKEAKTISRFVDSSEFFYDSEHKRYYKIHPKATISSVIRKSYFNPITLLSVISGFKKEIKIKVREVNENYFVELELPNLETWSLIVSSNLECKSFICTKFDDFYGDTTEKILWNNYEEVNGIVFPFVVTIFNRGHETYKVFQSLSLHGKQIHKSGIPKIIEEQTQVENMNSTIDSKSIEMKLVDKGLYEIIIERINRRLVLAEFKNSLILLGGLDNSRNGDALIDFIRKEFPGKPIEYGSFSYGTKHNMGVVRSLVANETKILASKNNADIIRELSKASFTKRIDNQEILMNTPIFRSLENFSSIEDSLNAMEIYKIETDLKGDYFVYYFPFQKVLFAGNIDEAYKRKFEGNIDEDSIFGKEILSRLKLNIKTVLVENLEL